MKPPRWKVALLPALLLAGCAAPNAQLALAPLDPAAAGLHGDAAQPIAGDWWKAMGDPQLDRIMHDALANNPTLDAALARLRLAESSVSLAAARRQPQVSLDGSQQVQRLSEVYMIPPPYGGSIRAVGEYAANLKWDLDFWDRQADMVRQAQAEAGVAALDLGAARLALSGAVAQAYVELSRAERQIANAEAAIAQRERSLELLRLRISSRLDSDFDVRAAETLSVQAQQALLRARADRETATHSLALLAGAGADYPAQIGPTSLSPNQLAAPTGNLPADLLSRRPDIVGAMLSIEAAAAGREVARKAFYPNINLLGITGLQAMGLDKLLTGGAITYGAGAAIHLPIFEGGQLRATHAGATARMDAAIATYNNLVLSAIREAADASTSVTALGHDLGLQRQFTSGLGELRRLGEIRVDSGLGSKLDLVDTEMQLLLAQQQTINLEAERANASIRLLVALGGGFDAAGANTNAMPSEQGNRK